MNKQRRHFTGAEKVAILKGHLVDKVAISDLCDELGLYPKLRSTAHRHLSTEYSHYQSPAKEPTDFIPCER